MVNQGGGERVLFHAYLIPMTIESGPASGTTWERRKPAFFSHLLQSAPRVIKTAWRFDEHVEAAQQA
jgi:hypothetical protein